MTRQTGACIVYTPERGIDLDMLRNDIKYLKRRYALDAKGKSEGRLVLRYSFLAVRAPSVC